MMKKQRRGVLLAALLVLFMLPVAAAAQEATMIYQNDFSTANEKGSNGSGFSACSVRNFSIQIISIHLPNL